MAHHVHHGMPFGRVDIGRGPECSWVPCLFPLDEGCRECGTPLPGDLAHTWHDYDCPLFATTDPDIDGVCTCDADVTCADHCPACNRTQEEPDEQLPTTDA